MSSLYRTMTQRNQVDWQVVESVMYDDSIPLSLKREALKYQRGIDGNLLHWACNVNYLPFEFIKTLVDIGGKKSVTEHD